MWKPFSHQLRTHVWWVLAVLTIVSSRNWFRERQADERKMPDRGEKKGRSSESLASLERQQECPWSWPSALRVFSRAPKFLCPPCKCSVTGDGMGELSCSSHAEQFHTKCWRFWLWACSPSWVVLCHDGAHRWWLHSALGQPPAGWQGALEGWGPGSFLCFPIGRGRIAQVAAPCPASSVLAVTDIWSGWKSRVFVQKVPEFQLSLPTSWKQILNIFFLSFFLIKINFAF